MKYPILIREEQPNRYTATALSLPDCKAEGATEAEALAKVTHEISQRLGDGKIVEVDVPTGGNPWLEFAGRSADDPDWEAYQAAIAEYRKSLDETE